MKKPFNILNYSSGTKPLIDFKPPTEAEMKEAVNKWRSFYGEIIASIPHDYEQDYITLKAVKYIRYNMKKYFTYTWKTDNNRHYLEHIGNEIYYTLYSDTRGESTGICHLDNQTLLRICKHFLSL